MWVSRAVIGLIGAGFLLGGLATMTDFRGLAGYLARREQPPWTWQYPLTSRTARLLGASFAAVGGGIVAVAIHGQTF